MAKSMPEGAKAAARGDERLGSYLRDTRGIGLSVTVVLPLVLLYQFGIVHRGSPVGNIAYVWLTGPFSVLGPHATTAVNVLVLAAMILALCEAERRGVLCLGYMGLMLMESVLYALLMFVAVVVAAEFVYGTVENYLMLPGVPRRLLLLSLGAGVYEELLFRLVLVGAGAALMRKVFEFNRFWSVAVMVVVSSVLFAAAHHVGSLGEEFNGFVFIFRMLCGLVLGVVYVARGLGIAAWTHALYNVLVLADRYA